MSPLASGYADRGAHLAMLYPLQIRAARAAAKPTQQVLLGTEKAGIELEALFRL